MREIKFRAKHGKEWVYGDLHLNSGKMPHIHSDPFTLKSINTETIGQYTGLKDKNGKEIYEGDILRSDEYPFNCDGVDNYFAEIVWADNVCCFYRITFKNPKSTVRGISHGICEQLDEEDIKSFEVIGNIYDNKELLNSMKRWI